ncbi:MAG: DUF72 domain-containing protein [Lentisphaerae bacterium]|nr:DUF72 domain-containing protein [Lentisphaerota bacterium]
MEAAVSADRSAAGKIAFGVAGWSYPDWNGYVYPPGTRDQLGYIAPYLDMIEVNSSFYRPPSAKAAAAWVRKTAGLPRFFFTAKLHRDITHGGMLDRAMVDAFREGFAPLREAGRLRHLLAQFKYDFADSAGTRDHLARMADAFRSQAAALAVELRNASWFEASALDWLESQGLNVVNLDYPGSAGRGEGRQVGAHGYFRLHGRNVKAWYSKDAGRDETYNYLYTPKELEGIAARALRIAGMTASLTMVANNHYQGKEAVNILQLKAGITGRQVPVPSALVRKYPELRAIELAGGQRELL